MGFFSRHRRLMALVASAGLGPLFTRLQHWLLLLLLLLLLSAPLQAAPRPEYQPTLWLLATGGVSALDVESGEVRLSLADTAEVQQLALEPGSGTLWSYGAQRLRSFAADGSPQVELLLEGVAGGAPATLAVDPLRGEVWLAQGQQLQRWAADGSQLLTHPLSTPAQGLAFDPARGWAWVLSRDELQAIDGAGAVVANWGLDSAGVGLAFDPYYGELWLATRSELLRFSGTGEPLWRRPLTAIQGLLADGQGGLWLRVGAALYHLMGAEPLDLAETGPLGTAIELPAAGGAAVAWAVDPSDGSLWLAQSRQLLQISPAGEWLASLPSTVGGALRGLALYRDRQPPQLHFEAPSAGAYLAEPRPWLRLRYADSGIGVDVSSLLFALDRQPVAAECEPQAQTAECRLVAPLAEGSVQLGAQIADYAGNRAQASLAWQVDLTPPLIELSQPAAGAVVQGAELRLSGRLSEPAQLTIAGVACPLTDTLGFSQTVTLLPGLNTLELLATDRAGLTGRLTLNVTYQPAETLPPDPASVAPPIDPTLPSDFASATAFLYSGPHPLQTGVAAATIEPQRVAVIRGRVVARDGTALPGVQLTVNGHPEFGATRSRADGAFDLAVNGGDSWVLDYQLAGYLPAQRVVATRWQRYSQAPEVALVALDPQVTSIALGADHYQVAQGSPSEDSDGRRQATLLFPPGVQGTLVLADGQRQPLSQGAVRATEYTVGAYGPQAMPGELPPSSGYTYAVELSLDEAIAAGAQRVEFDRPIPLYVENFLHFPVGGRVPVGWYDRTAARWRAAADGRVIQLLAVEAGVAQLDISGSGQAATEEALAALGIDLGERRQLASLYPVGSRLWRTPIQHFTPWDCNWPYGPPLGAATPPAIPAPAAKEDRPDCQRGSIIECQNQVLGESIPLIGTGFRLHYRSDRAGQAAWRSFEFDLTGVALPPELLAVVFQVEVAGRRLSQHFPPQPDQHYTFIWDGQDAYGRQLYGRFPAQLRIGYVYRAVYYSPAERAQFEQSFALPGVDRFEGSYARQTITLWSERELLLDGPAPHFAGLGGWSIDPQHAYDPTQGLLYRGDGGRSRNEERLDTLTTTVHPYNWSPQGLAAAADGSLYASERYTLWQVTRSGTLQPQLTLEQPLKALAPGRAGELYLSSSERVWRWRPGEASATWIAGSSGWDYNGDNQLATAAQLNPRGLAVGPEGALYIADYWNNRVRRIGGDGLITTVAGNGSLGSSGDGGRAVAAGLNRPQAVAVGRDGSLYIAESRQIRRVTPDGVISTLAAVGGESLALAPDGSLFVTGYSQKRIYHVSLEGWVTVVAGTGLESGERIEGGIASRARLRAPRALAVGADGALYVADSLDDAIFRVDSLRGRVGGLVAAIDGREYYQFDAAGRHLATFDSLSGTPRYRFDYAEGQLSAIHDAFGNTTRIERNADGTPQAVVAADGQRTPLTLDANGWLQTVVQPDGGQWQLHHSAAGLLTDFTNPRHQPTHFVYDPDGRLSEEENAAGGGWRLARQPLPAGYQVTLDSAEGRHHRYQVERDSAGGNTLSHQGPDGGEATRWFGSAAQRRYQRRDGTLITLQEGPDPRVGMAAPLLSQWTVTTPSGLSLAGGVQRTAQLSDPLDPLSHSQLTEQYQLNGHSTTLHYQVAEWLLTLTSPMGRSVELELDTAGQVIRRSVPGRHPIYYQWDPRGRLTAIRQGEGEAARTTRLDYHPSGPEAGWLATLTDPQARTTAFDYDPAGRITEQRLADGRQLHFGYDAMGNLTELWPPGREAHQFAYTPLDQTEQYDPPPLESGPTETHYRYNRDRQLTEIQRPDGEVVGLSYDGAGRLDQLHFPGGAVSYGYDPQSGRLAHLTTASGERLDYRWDGFLLTSEAASGSVAGSVERHYNADLRLQSLEVAGTAYPYEYDADGLLTAAGALHLSRDAGNGQLIASELDGVRGEQHYTPWGELASEAAYFGDQLLWASDYQRDPLGRIVEQQERTATASTTYHYRYDAAGRLAEVWRDGVLSAHYGYDANGNRTHLDGVEIAHYDHQDRLLESAGVSYGYSANGELAQRTTAAGSDHYHYDPFGSLREVELADGTHIEYLIDGRQRRVGRRVNGVLVQGLLYADQLNPVAELDGTGQVVARFIYGAKGQVPSYMEKGGQRYRLISDRLGSVRQVVNSRSGEVVQRLDYDAWGNLVLDTAPGFQPFGFAGGLYDPATRFTRFGYRDYDAAVGRWVAKDPIGFEGGDANVYAYVGGDPINGIDYFGLARLVFYPESGTLYVYPELDGASPYVMPASSGRPSCGCDETTKNEGPIPRGSYSLNNSEVTNPGFMGDILRNTQGDWGSWRVPLHPGSTTNTYGRTGFFLHGGSLPGSAGCIDIGGGWFGDSQTDRLLNDLLNDPDGVVSVGVFNPY